MLGRVLSEEEIKKTIKKEWIEKNKHDLEMYNAGFSAAQLEIHKYSNPEKGYFNSKTNSYVIVWEDGSTTQATCCKEDHFDPIVGFAIAYCAKAFGSKKKFKDKVKELTKENKKAKKESSEDEKGENE